MDTVFASSTFTAEQLISVSGIGAARVHAIHLPVTPVFEAQVPNASASEAQLLSVGRVSRESRYKGYYEIADCLPIVREKVPDVRWQIVGDGDDVPELSSYCQSRGLGSHAVTFTAGLTDAELANVYRRSRVFVLPSVARITERIAEGEGFGIVYAEAGMVGVPSIASTDGGGALDFVQHEVTGLTVRPRDRDGLAAAIVKVLTDTSYRDALGREARTQALRHHTSAAFEAELLGRIGKLLIH